MLLEVAFEGGQDIKMPELPPFGFGLETFSISMGCRNSGGLVGR